MTDLDFGCLESRSVSDGESDSERRLRRSRRKRGGGRVRPYDMSPEHHDEDEAPKKKTSTGSQKKKSDRRDRHGMAPPNSTQFLLDDREERANAEYENELKFEAAERRRIRSMSGSYEQMRHAFWGATTIEPTTMTGGSGSGTEDAESVSGESEADREMEREFETDYLAVKRERIQSMTKSQLAQELLERDHDTQLLAQELGSKDAENRHLRRLLNKHGIDLGDGSDDVTSPGLPNCVETSPTIIAN